MSVSVNRIAIPRVDGWLGRAARLLWPARCLICHAAGLPGLDLCAGCIAALPWNHHACRQCAIPLPASSADARCGECLQQAPPLHATHAALVYGFPLDRLLPRFKFHNDLAVGRLLAQLMADAFAGAQRPDALLPIPLHRTRLRARGYDQALELARPLSRALGIPLLHDAMRRDRATAPQSELDAAQRRRNLRKAFAIEDGTALPRHIALIDDVMTTGATLHAAADCLRRAGVARVDAWVCARAP
jgi:ComF family protein